MTDALVAELSETLARVAGHLSIWASDHSQDRTSETESALFCAVEVLRKAGYAGPTDMTAAGIQRFSLKAEENGNVLAPDDLGAFVRFDDHVGALALGSAADADVVVGWMIPDWNVVYGSGGWRFLTSDQALRSPEDWEDGEYDAYEKALAEAVPLVPAVLLEQSRSEVAVLKRDIVQLEKSEQHWLEEATYEVGGASHSWSLRAQAAERRLLDAGLDCYCGAVVPGSFKAVPSYWELQDRLKAAEARIVDLEAAASDR